MNPVDFNHFCALVKQRSGIEIGDTKAYLVESRLGQIAGTAGQASVAGLLRAIRISPDERVIEAAIDAMTTNETFFFRDGTPFQALRQTVLPELCERRNGAPVRIWSAACSTGQEPYSLAMLAEEEKARLPRLSVDILGTDLSDRCLQKAAQGAYSQFEVQRGLSIQQMIRFFDQADGAWKAKADLRAKVRWRRQNLLRDFAGVGPADLIFCRNVLIYFDRPTKAQVLERLARTLSDGGYLVLGAAETVLGLSEAFEVMAGSGGLYRRKSTVGAAPPAALRAGAR